VGKPYRKRPLSRLGVNGKIILNQGLYKSFGRWWRTGLIWLSIVKTGGHLRP
jgi:hypothetical protein